MRPGVLICSYHYAPVATPRAIRWVHFVRHLRGRGWNVEVLTICPSRHHPQYDGTFGGSPEPVHRTAPGPLYSLRYDVVSPKSYGSSPHPRGQATSLSLRSRLKAATAWLDPVFFPDKAVEWVPIALARARRLVREKQLKIVITSGAPFSTHLLGALLRPYEGVRWIADYGDPWSVAERPPRGRLRRRLERGLERWMLERADGVVVTTEETKARFQEAFPFLSGDRVRVIPQGYDTDLYADAGASVSGGDGPVRVCHTGTFYHGLRDPWQFFEAVSPFDPQDWRILFVGDIEALDQSRLRHMPRAVDLLRHRSVAECAELQKSSSLLVLFAHHSNQQVPGKVFEYFAARRPVLVVASVRDDPVSRMVVQRRRGWVVRNESGAIRKELGALQRLHLCGRLEEGLDLSPVPEFRWERRCELLEDLLEAVSANGSED